MGGEKKGPAPGRASKSTELSMARRVVAAARAAGAAAGRRKRRRAEMVAVAQVAAADMAANDVLRVVGDPTRMDADAWY
jgi:hypothetical protein